MGDTIEIHESGMLTFPILGTAAPIQDKLSYDPDRSKRRAVYDRVVDKFPEYKVYVGGSSSFDIVPHPYAKLYALDLFCRRGGFLMKKYGISGMITGLEAMMRMYFYRMSLFSVSMITAPFRNT